MITVHTFTFNPYQENTYLLIDEEKNCIIVDPGMYGLAEEQQLKDYIEQEKLNPILLLNTHCHIDHVLGNKYVYDTWNLLPNFHEGEIPTLIAVNNYAPQMGFRYETSPIPETFIKENDIISLGRHQFKAIYAPGHSPAHLCYYNEEYNLLIGGDVLFRNSIGRTDLPGGNHQLLIENIKSKIYTLPEETVVYPGHGPTTTIGFEKRNNQFVRA